MKKISRREFLKITRLGAEGLLLQQLLTACGVKPNTDEPVSSTPAVATVTDIPAADVPSEASVAPVNVPDLAVVRGGDPEQLVQKALEAFGGMGAFVTPGAKVVVKPNICNAYNSYEYASTTNPWVVGALVKLCLEAGASSVKVLDFPFGGTPERAYVTSGIREQVEAVGGQMEVLSNLKFVPTDIPQAVTLRHVDAYQEALDADVLINVPIAKHHGTTRLTLGMKNMMGLVKDREALHAMGIGVCIADLASLFRPALTVIDAVRILTANGPTGGNLNDVQKLDTLIVSPDIVAADSYATSLFGLKPEDISYIAQGVARGLGRSDLENLNIQEINLAA